MSQKALQTTGLIRASNAATILAAKKSVEPWWSGRASRIGASRKFSLLTELLIPESTELLDEEIVPFIERHYTESTFFQHENAPAHIKKYIKDWFMDSGLTYLDWQARSPDLNPIENLWGVLPRNANEGMQPFDYVDNLRDAIEQHGKNTRWTTCEVCKLHDESSFWSGSEAWSQD